MNIPKYILQWKVHTSHDIPDILTFALILSILLTSLEIKPEALLVIF